MAITHNLGFPRIGKQRELKFALESYWQGKGSRDALRDTALELRRRHWALQSDLDWAPVGDFSFYDQVLDMSFTLGNLPGRVRGYQGDALDNYFRVARGRSGGHAHEAGCCHAVTAGEMTKWFDTNYHYIVPEFESTTQFSLNASRLLEQWQEARSQGVKAKPVIIGPVTYLALGKAKDDSDKLALLERLLPVYTALLEQLAQAGAEWVQIDEPILVMELDAEWQQAFRQAYQVLAAAPVKLLLTSYFGRLGGNLALAAELPVAGLHIDAVNAADDIPEVLARLSGDRILSLGVVNGRNIWKSRLNELLDRLEPIAQRLGDRLWIAPSCSLLHIPTDLDLETGLDDELRSWLAFATQRLEEIRVLGKALNQGRQSVQAELEQNREALQSRDRSTRVHNPAVQQALAEVTPALGQRQSTYKQRATVQAARLNLPLFPTTTIGSFPQTEEIRRSRRQYKAGEIGETAYRQAMEAEIERCIREQEALGLDVLVHGEAERNDMVEYFGEQLDGFAFSRHGWVQSYGSRCVKPPILYGDVHRSHPMTVDWIRHAQSLTSKPVKGMLTGPVTILAWSFVRDDIPLGETANQVALALRDEIHDLEEAGIRIIQVDEPALRELLPLKASEHDAYLDWSVNSFRLATAGVEAATQIHTHLCYSEFGEVIDAIDRLDADVTSIEAARSRMEVVADISEWGFKRGIGPGVYDIHSPRIPAESELNELVNLAILGINPKQLWVNPDCGLKTRAYPETVASLKNMIAATEKVRATLG